MTHHSVNDLASSFVEMAKAYERLPEVQKELDRWRDEANQHLETIQRLELRLIDRNTNIEQLQFNIRKLEEARDDAELRFLECDDAKTTLERTLEGLGQDIASVLAAVRPMPIPVPEPVAATEPTLTTDVPLVDGPIMPYMATEGEKEYYSIPFATGTDTSPPDALSSDATTGQSEPDPTFQSAYTGTENATSMKDYNALPVAHGSNEGVSVSSDPTILGFNPATSSSETASGSYTYHDYDNDSRFIGF